MGGNSEVLNSAHTPLAELSATPKGAQHNPMEKVIGLPIIACIVIAILGERFVNFRARLWPSREIKQNHLPNCQLIQGIDHGSEDITVLPNGLALFSSGLKYPMMPNYGSDAPGNLYVMNLEEDTPTLSELKISQGFDLISFNPHGISTYIDKEDNMVYVFVVNHLHPHFTSHVEIFKFVEEDKSLTHLKTITHELLTNVNDIVAVGPESFYATNDHYFKDQSLRFLEKVLGLAWCNVVYYSPEEVKVVGNGLHFANGINLSPDSKYLYVADIFGSCIHILEVQEDKNLTPVKVLHLGTLVDNIDVDQETGDLWVGCHPNGWKMFNYNPEVPPGSEVLQIKNIHSEKPMVFQAYADNGSVIQGSSVAVPYKGRKLLIGTIFHKALLCNLNPLHSD
ncbi:serum paraoxonase/arylesterase 2-like [Erpetoichthys calabaricus]|uniref:serum paraoxonase/arylesterase 2-like n=1 Tax=Erpetoichthys calabaricus TaxID=27687 RepID=UPI0022345824|nr:serum paraoxonase/arylesterase 2-like [Erpetoichthys calabaricus]